MAGSFPFPFPWPNHGVLSLDAFDKCDGFVLVLRDEPSAADREWIERTCPSPIAGFFEWSGPRLRGESEGDVFDALVIDGWGDDDEKAGFRVGLHAAAGFSAALEAWVLAVHARCPVRAFEGPGYPDADTPWGAWSEAQLDAEPCEALDTDDWV
ncbi:MAG: hypothetical protein H6737_23115 [Alphaproteobacteria bacterium]|nr:hypothetical protein [Alphaproteobacteria bacterium]